MFAKTIKTICTTWCFRNFTKQEIQFEMAKFFQGGNVSHKTIDRIFYFFYFFIFFIFFIFAKKYKFEKFSKIAKV